MQRILWNLEKTVLQRLITVLDKGSGAGCIQQARLAMIVLIWGPKERSFILTSLLQFPENSLDAPLVLYNLQQDQGPKQKSIGVTAPIRRR